MPRPRDLAGSLMAAAVLATLTGGPAAASCLAPEGTLDEQLEAYEVVFVGTAGVVEDEGRVAHFAVAEVWRGEAAAAQTVRGGPEGPGITSVDVIFVEGETYLVAANYEGTTLATNSCTPTQPWRDELAVARPADITTPTASPSGGIDTVWVVVGGLALAALATVGGVMVFDRRRHHSTP